MLTAADIKQVRSLLRPLTFDIDQDESNATSPALQKYLDHYRINFARSLPGVRHGFGSFEVDGYTIAAHYWMPEMPRGTVFVFHGYYDHVGLYHHLIRFSLQNDYAVLAYDLPGMGLSSGERATIDSFERYYRVMLSASESCTPLLPRPWFAIGQSTGCAPLLQHVMTAGLAPFAKIVLLAPLLRSRGWQRLRWLHLFGQYFVRSLPRIFSINSHDEDFLQFVKSKDPLQDRVLPVRWAGAMKEWIRVFSRYPPQPHPLLLIQGDEDQTVDWKHNLEQITEKLPNTRVKMISQGRHHLVAESAPYRAQVFAAIKAYLEEAQPVASPKRGTKAPEQQGKSRRGKGKQAQGEKF